MAANPVSLADSSIRLPLEDGAFHVRMRIPFSIIWHFDPSISQCRPRKPWVAKLFGQCDSLPFKTVKLAIRHLFQISQQPSGLLFGREEPVRFSVASCDVDNWEHLGSSNFLLTFSVGAEDNGNTRVLVFEANEKLVRGSIHFSGEEFGEKEKAAWTAGWTDLVKPCGRPDSFLTPLEREMRDENLVQYYMDTTWLRCLAVSTRTSRPEAYFASHKLW